MPRHIERITGRSSRAKPVGGRPVVALGLDEVAVEDRRASPASTRGRRPRTGRRATRRRSRARTSRRRRASSRSPRTAALLGVERVGQRHRRDVAVALGRSRAPPRGPRRCAPVAPARKSRSPRPVSASARVRSSASPPQANASSSQRWPSTTVPRQPVRPAGAAGDRQRGLGVVVGDRPVERRPEVVVLLVDGRQPRPLPVAGVGGGALARTARRSAAAIASRTRTASPRSASCSRPYWASVCSWVKRSAVARWARRRRATCRRGRGCGRRGRRPRASSSAHTASAVARSQPPGNTDSRSKTRCSSSKSSS